MTMKSISRDIPDTSFDATAGGVAGPHAIEGSLSELHLKRKGAGGGSM